MIRINWWGSLVLLATSSVSLACDDKGAFGFEFGKPVPKDADAEQHDGGSVPNAMGCFYGTMPAPLPGFEKHSYCANRDRKFVYALDASFEVEPGDEGMAKARERILAIKKEWEEKFGFQYNSDSESGLSWTAETPTVSARIYMLFGEKVIVECTNRALESKAMQIALKSW